MVLFVLGFGAGWAPTRRRVAATRADTSRRPFLLLIGGRPETDQSPERGRSEMRATLGIQGSDFDGTLPLRAFGPAPACRVRVGGRRLGLRRGSALNAGLSGGALGALTRPWRGGKLGAIKIWDDL